MRLSWIIAVLFVGTAIAVVNMWWYQHRVFQNVGRDVPFFGEDFWIFLAVSIPATAAIFALWIKRRSIASAINTEMERQSGGALFNGEKIQSSIEFGFTIYRSSDGQEFGFEKQGGGIGGGAWLGFLFAGAIIGAPLTFLITVESAKTFEDILVVWLAIIGAFGGLAYLLNLTRAQTYRFRITPDAICVNDKCYAKTNISELLVRNKSGRASASINVERGGVVIGGGATGAAYVAATALASGMRQMGEGAAEAIKDSMSKRGNSVCIRHGKRVIPLAQYMLEDDAKALLNKIAEIMKGH